MTATEADVSLEHAPAERRERSLRRIGQKGPLRKLGVQLEAVGVVIVAVGMGLFSATAA